MGEFGTKEYYKNKVEELKNDMNIYISALKQFCMTNRYDEDIIYVCKKIADACDGLNFANSEIERLSEYDNRF